MGDLPKEIEGGAIIRFANGHPTGEFIPRGEICGLPIGIAGVMVDNAMTLIPNPPRSGSVMREYFDLAMKDALAHGLTSIHDAMSSPEMISFFKK